VIASKHFDPVMGVDIHILTIPPVGPVPIPHPHISMVLDPMDYVPVMGGTVIVGGLPRGTAGTAGTTIPHIPLGGPFAKGPPGNEDEIFMGSMSVLADGAPFTFTALPSLSCQDIGMPAPVRAKKPKKSYSMLLPTSMVVSVPAGPPVLVGGAPTVDMMGLLMAGAFAALGPLAKKLRNSKFAQKLGKKFKKAKKKAFKNMKPGFLKCKILKAEPVNSITGEVVVDQSDFDISGIIPLAWNRFYGSQSTYRGVCGNGWQTPADARLELDRDASVSFFDGGMGAAVFPFIPTDSTVELLGDSDLPHKAIEIVDGAELTLENGEFKLKFKGGLTYHFERSHQDLKKRVIQSETLYATRVTDGLGNMLLFVRDENRQLNRIEESAGRALLFTTENGLVNQIDLRHPDSKQKIPLVRYEYDKEDNLISVFNPQDDAYQFFYQDGRLCKHTDRNGLSFYYEYELIEGVQKCIRAYGDGGLYDYSFKYEQQLSSYTDSLGHQYYLQYDENNLPLKEYDELGLLAEYSYDDAGRTVAVTDAKGNATEYSYDDYGNIIELREPCGLVTKTKYDEEHNAIEITDPNGNLWRQDWLEKHLLKRQITPEGAVTEYFYNSFGLIAKIINPNGFETAYAYDKFGNPTHYRDAAGHIIEHAFDYKGNLIKEVQPSGKTQYFEYDKNSNVTKIVNPSGTEISCNYDAEGNLVSHKDERGLVTRFEYAGLGELARRIQPDNSTITFLRNTEEQLEAVINELGQKYQFNYDARGRVTQEVDYWGAETQFKYDESGNIIAKKNALNQELKFEYDELGRLIKKILSDSSEETFEYDGNSNLVSLSNDNRTCTRTFDRDNRLIVEAQDDFKVVNEYDPVGNRVKRKTDCGNDVRFTYDVTGELASIQINEHPSFNLERDADGRTIKETFGRHFERQYVYNKDGFIVNSRLSANYISVAEQAYTYDSAGNLLEQYDRDSGRSYFSYDPLGRLTKYKNPDSKIEQFLYDAGGNISQSSEGFSEDTELRKATYKNSEFYYDKVGNLVEKNGPKQHYRYEWDSNNHLKRSTNGEGTATDFHYDAIGRRTKKETDENATVFFWDDEQLLIDVKDGCSREFVYYPGTSEPIAVITQGNQVYYYHNEPNGAASKVVSASGEVLWAASYHPLGGLASSILEAFDNPLRLEGQYYDHETGLAYTRHRYFDSDICAFVSQDPLGLEAGRNLYFYAPNIFGWVDPTGLSCKKKDHFVYVLKDKSGKVKYVGITKQKPRNRMLQHARDGKKFHHMEVISENLTYRQARDLEGSALHWANKDKKILLNKRRKGGNRGYIHSYGGNSTSKTKRKPMPKSAVNNAMNNGLYSIF